MKKRIVSLLLALVMVLSLVPTTVWAAEDHDGQVRVIVENTTYAKADGAAWDGTLVDKWVDLVPGSSMMDCIVSALGSYSQTGAESGYITEINGEMQLGGSVVPLRFCDHLRRSVCGLNMSGTVYNVFGDQPRACGQA